MLGQRAERGEVGQSRVGVQVDLARQRLQQLERRPFGLPDGAVVDQPVGGRPGLAARRPARAGPDRPGGTRRCRPPAGRADWRSAGWTASTATAAPASVGVIACSGFSRISPAPCAHSRTNVRRSPRSPMPHEAVRVQRVQLQHPAPRLGRLGQLLGHHDQRHLLTAGAEPVVAERQVVRHLAGHASVPCRPRERPFRVRPAGGWCRPGPPPSRAGAAARGPFARRPARGDRRRGGGVHAEQTEDPDHRLGRDILALAVPVLVEGGHAVRLGQVRRDLRPSPPLVVAALPWRGRVPLPRWVTMEACLLC